MRSIHHVAIICSDYVRSRAFYTEVLGLQVLHEAYRDDRGSWKCDLDASVAPTIRFRAKFDRNDAISFQ